MYDEGAQRLDLWQIDNKTACSHYGHRPTKEASAATLERWRLLSDLLLEWLRSDGSEEEARRILNAHLAGIDEVTGALVTDWFHVARRVVHPEDGELDPDPVRPRVTDETGSRYLTMPLTFAIEGDDEREEFRLVTGRFGTSEVEAAIYYADAEPKTRLFDLRVTDGEVVSIEAPDNTSELIAQTFSRDAENSERQGPPRPGLHCYGCPSVLRCGEYPLISDGTPRQSTRTVVLSRSQLSELSRCERRVAWQRVHRMPREEDAGGGHGASVGSFVHEMIGAHLGGASPEQVRISLRASCPPDLWAEAAHLFDQHLRLWDEEPSIRIVAVEREMGFGGMLDDPHGRGDGAVAVIGRPDVNGWEDDATAAVVEFRTGGVTEPYPYEREFYAVAAWEKIRAMGRQVTGVAVHHHFLRPDIPVCDRRVFSEPELVEARSTLAEVARIALSWDPVDAAQPPYEVGDWCSTCPFENRCREHRTGAKTETVG